VEILRPATIDEALALLAAHAPQVRVLAGGTDLVVRLKEGAERPARLLSLGRCTDLRTLREENAELVLGACLTHAELEASPLLRRHAPLLAHAAASVGSVQVRERGTVGGNVANASPSADAVVALRALEAVLVLRRAGGTRRVPLGEFARGPKSTVLAPDELLAEIRFPLPPDGESQSWHKIGPREALACAKLSLAFRARRENGVLRGVRIAWGGVAPTVVRSPGVEAILEGARPEPPVLAAAAAALERDITPIDDVRSDAWYRRRVAEALLRRATLAG
jgi:aerobic carbon-monoxide dehydrogenase medium subunit